MPKTVQELEQELKVARQLEAQERQQLMDRTPVLKQYFIAEESKQYSKIYDPAIKLYRLVSVITNKVEAQAAGHRVDTDGAGMSYLYNTATQKIVMPLGGGYIFIGGFSSINEATLDELNKFLIENPKGGDITELVIRDQERERQ